MARLSVAAAGNADENINLINPRFQAEALRRVRGRDIGVLDNSFDNLGRNDGLERIENSDYMWKLTATNVANISVGRGMATAYGYDIQSEETVYFVATSPSVGLKYLFVYLEWDLSNPDEAVGSIEIYDNGGGLDWTPSRQDNLITNPIGTYQLPLYRIAINTDGSIVSIITWSELGVKTIGAPLRAEYSGYSDKSNVATFADGDTNITIKEHINSIYARIIAMGFKHGGINLSLGNTAFSLSDSKQANGYYPLQRQGNYVIGNLQILAEEDENGSTTNQLYVEVYSSKTQTFTLGTLPEDFRPKTETIAGFTGTTAMTGTSIKDNTSITVNTSGEIILTVRPNSTVFVNDGYYKIGIRSIIFGFEAESLLATIDGYTEIWNGEVGGNESDDGATVYNFGDTIDLSWQGAYSIVVFNKTTNETKVISEDIYLNWQTDIFGNTLKCIDIDEYTADSSGYVCLCNQGSGDIVVTSIVKVG
jgi:hypothetical protein